jgi:tRNA-2-methylthio-N6-dimethylallyladenosine synthase
VVELTLLGQNINSYTWEYPDGRRVGLGHLIRELDKVEGLRRVRFVTSHPADMDDDILKAMGDCAKAAPYLHMPAQSGSDEMLRRMRRGYTRAFYLERVARARELIPGVAVASDFIVGFPGETDADFEATVSLVREARFKNSFIFKYSPRPGTPAHKVDDDVPKEVKRQRNIRLLAVQEEVAAAENRRFVGRTVEVLCEGPSKRAEARAAAESATIRLRLYGESESAACGEGEACEETAAPTATAVAERPGVTQLVGRTASDHIVIFDGPADLRGRFVNVAVERVSAVTLFGSLVS